jgi:hypothetical protein
MYQQKIYVLVLVNLAQQLLHRNINSSFHTYLKDFPLSEQRLQQQRMYHSFTIFSFSFILFRKFVSITTTGTER